MTTRPASRSTCSATATSRDAAAFNYAFGAARQISTTKLDAAGFSLRGQPFSTLGG
jgi:hypothetical protein